MLIIVGWVIVLGVIFGGYVISGGSMGALVHPVKLMMIVGAAVGAMIASASSNALKAVLRDAPAVFKGSKYTKALYLDLLCLLFDILTKVRKEGLMSVEEEIEEPKDSPLFSKYPKVLADHHLTEFIVDYLRMMVSGNMNSLEMENLMDIEIETHHKEASIPIGLMNKLGDSMPAFGIVAAVMGVVITMGSLHLPPAELGPMIGAALVGAFVGILFGYGIISPIASAMEIKAEEASKSLECVKVSLLASLNGYPPPVAIEFGRKVLFSPERPGFQELEETIKERK
ncbi:MAG: flagellar motor stator protein MotA [Halothiobacillaceae bacterium]